jgi:ABC-type dipeptide/oligopeptide/nickel transport system ATPase component
MAMETVNMAGKQKQTSNNTNTEKWPRGKAIPQDRCDLMYESWLKTKSLSMVEKEFGHSHSAVAHISKRDKWTDRQKKIQGHLRDKQDKKIEQGLTSNLERVAKVRDIVYQAILKKKNKLKPNLRDLVLIMEYEDKLLGNMPGDNQKPGNILNVFTNMPAPEQSGVVRDTRKVLESICLDDNEKVFGDLSVDLSSS